MSRIMGIGIIGCGNISWTYLTLAKLFRGIEIRAVADIDAGAAGARAREFGVAAQPLKALLQNPEVGIVVNLTVPAVHFKVSKQILEAGKHVYSEKPLTLAYKDAQSLLALAARNGLRIGAAPDTFLGGAHQLARQAIDGGMIGKVVSGTCHCMGPGMETWHPNPDFFFRPGGGPMLDMGPYYITNLVNLLGPVKRVSALAVTGRKQRQISGQPGNPRNGEALRVTTPTTYHALLDFAGGAAVTLSMSWDVWAHEHQNMELYGQTGAMYVPDPNFFGGDVVVVRGGEAPKALPRGDHPLSRNNWGPGNRQSDPVWANYRGIGLAEMADAIQLKRQPRCDITFAAHVLEVMTAVMKAGQERKVIELSSTCRRPLPFGTNQARALLK